MLISFKSATVKDEHSESGGGGQRQYCVFQREAGWTRRAKGTDSQELLHWKDLAELTDFSHSL